jgi:Cys-rich repeat protein
MFGVVIIVVAIVAVLGLSTTLIAQEPGDVGSEECRLVQMEVQDAVADGMPYKNHGQMVRTVANNVNPSLGAGYITGGCFSCITKQFARRIPIDEQEACGYLEPYCSSNSDCTSGQYCEKAEGDCLGVGMCADLAQCCPQVYIPVCGCDGITYSNECTAAQYGMNVLYDGECGP